MFFCDIDAGLAALWGFHRSNDFHSRFGAAEKKPQQHGCRKCKENAIMEHGRSSAAARRPGRTVQCPKTESFGSLHGPRYRIPPAVWQYSSSSGGSDLVDTDARFQPSRDQSPTPHLNPPARNMAWQKQGEGMASFKNNAT